MKTYIARDNGGRLFVYDKKPLKSTLSWQTQGFYLPIDDSDLPEGINPQWEDPEPIEVELKIERYE